MLFRYDLIYGRPCRWYGGGLKGGAYALRVGGLGGPPLASLGTSHQSYGSANNTTRDAVRPLSVTLPGVSCFLLLLSSSCSYLR